MQTQCMPFAPMHLCIHTPLPPSTHAAMHLWVHRTAEHICWGRSCTLLRRQCPETANPEADLGVCLLGYVCVSLRYIVWGCWVPLTGSTNACNEEGSAVELASDYANCLFIVSVP